MDPDSVAKAFVEHYYRTFDSNRAALGGLYQDGSMLTFEGSKTQGAQAIAAKLASLPFEQCVHAISTVDCQPSGPQGGVLVFVSGQLQLAGETHPLKFSQVLGFPILIVFCYAFCRFELWCYLIMLDTKYRHHQCSLV
jgi:Nuclear transport factor 2 (NTF2) domain